jgi:2',3'-cyclic-nucleotide 2'-phosphodiesterase (5'-nucleotidase family)
MMAAARRKPDCAIWNSGSLRIDDVLKGQVVVLDVVRMLPFGGGLTEVDMTGALLRRTLATGRSNLGSGGYLQTKNVMYDELARQWFVGNQPLSDSKTYKVILPDFLLTGNEQNMEFLKTTPEKPAEGIQKVYLADPKNTSDPRNDIRRALISYWKMQ